MRSLHFSAALAAAFAVALPVMAAEISGQVVKLGVLTDLSGNASDMSGSGSVAAAQLAIEDAGGSAAGVPVQLISADHQLKPDIGAEIARRWYDVEGVDAILDVPSSAVALAVQEVARERSRILITHASGTSDFTGRACSPTGMQWVFDTYALANGTARAVTRRGGDTWFFLTADYAFGQALERDAGAVVAAAGGKVLGGVRHPFNAADLTSFVLQAQSSKAKIIGLANGPPDTANAIKLGGEFGVFLGGQQMAGLLVFITDIHALGLKAAQGLLLTTGFYWDRDEESRAFARRFFERRRAMPTMVQAGVYSSVRHYLKAVSAAGSDAAPAVAAKMRELPVEDAFAKRGTLRPDGRMVYDLMLAQVKTPAASTRAWDYYEILETIPGDQAFRSLADTACPALKKGG